MTTTQKCPGDEIAQQLAQARDEAERLKGEIKDKEDQAGITDDKAELKEINKTIKGLEQQLISLHQP